MLFRSASVLHKISRQQGYQDLSLLTAKVPSGNLRSHERKFPGTFAPENDVPGTFVPGSQFAL